MEGTDGQAQVTLDDLPATLIERILRHTGSVRAVLSASAVSRRLRDAADGGKVLSRYSFVDDGLEHLLTCERLGAVLGPHATHVDLSWCTVATDKALRIVAVKTRALRHLSVACAEDVTDAGLDHLASLSALESLDLAGCNVTDRGLQSLGRVTTLRHLVLAARSRSRDASPHQDVIAPRARPLDITDAGVGHLMRLRRLQSLDLSGSAHVMSAGMASVQRLAGLTSLVLRDCGRVGDSAVAHLPPGLCELDLSRTDVGDVGVKALASTCPKLTSLRLSICRRVTDAAVERLPQLPLQALSLAGTAVTDAGLAHVGSLRGLTNLDLSVCERITDGGLAALRTLPRLRSLSLWKCRRLTDGALAQVGELRTLEQLDIGGLVCQGTGLSRVTALTRLTDLQAAETSRPSIHGIASLSALRRLNLESARGLCDADLGSLSGCQGIEELSLRDCPGVSDDGLASLAGLTSLQVLLLSLCVSLTDAGLASLRGLARLRELELAQCSRVTGAAFAHLRGLTALTRLDVASTAISDAGLSCLQSLTALRVLDLSRCRAVTDHGVAQFLATLPHLHYVRLEECSHVGGEGVRALWAIPRIAVRC